MSDSRWGSINQALGLDNPEDDIGDANTPEQTFEMAKMHKSAKNWLAAETSFTIIILIVTISAGADQHT